VFKEAFRNDDFSGFCLYDKEFPLIIINNSMSKTRQIFTLFQELGHLLFETSGIDKLNDDYIDILPEHDKDIEILCNRLAAEILVGEVYYKHTSVNAEVQKYSSLQNKYVLIKGKEGLGNRILSALTGILYAEISGRKIYIDWSDDVYSNEDYFPVIGKDAYWELTYALSVEKADGSTVHYHNDDLKKFNSSFTQYYTEQETARGIRSTATNYKL